jgi:hypothetical protein
MFLTTKRKRVSDDEGRRVRPIQVPSPPSSDISDDISPATFLSKTAYQATDLDLSNREIRLVELVKNPDTHIIRLKFHKKSLQDNVEYTALSYMWGESKPTREIFINSEVFEVRENLWQFLYQARKHSWHKLFWIDAICIDQEDTRERNHQVALMRSIYSEAAQVAVWLGSAAHESDLAIDRLNEGISRPGRTTNGVPPWTKEESEAILELCQRQYWRRIWIVQEVVLGKKTIFYCGAKSLQEMKLATMFEELERWGTDRESSTFLHRLVHQSDASSIIRQRTSWHQDPKLVGFGVIELLRAHKYKECTDLRDRIYGLLSLAKETQIKLLNITADYSNSTSDIYRQILNAYCDVYRPDRAEVESLANSLYDIFQFSPSDHWVRPFLKELSGRVRTEIEEDWEVFTGTDCEKNCISRVLLERDTHGMRQW